MFTPTHTGRKPLSAGVAAIALTVLVATGCGQATAKSDAGRPTSRTATATRMSAEDATADPADEICSDETRTNITNQLASQPAPGRVTKPVVKDKAGTRTTCTYQVTGGSLRMVVDEVADKSAAKRLFAADRARQPQVTRVPNLGTDAFSRPDGTTFTIKDDKVLTVDPTHLPVGDDRTQIAQSLSFEILSCWSG